MRIKYFAVALLFTACNASKTNSDAPTPVQAKEVGPIDYAKTITEEELKEHLYIYASDEFEGRETGQPGQKKAVEYLTNEYKSLSIAPGNKVPIFKRFHWNSEKSQRVLWNWEQPP
ncbi:hypothetical protein [Aureicoccus marinus]|uniref:hypothetical protein n=1 Tax=Aureicoccus marinus TaxID=754435 RepID=UPI0026C6A156|nr:hypothetical protein [Aureicoccus marinus]